MSRRPSFQSYGLPVLMVCGAFLTACGGTLPGAPAVPGPALGTAPSPAPSPAPAPSPTNPSPTMPTPSPVVTLPPASAQPGGEYARRVLELTNAARAQGRTCGAQSYPAAPPLAYNARLETAATAHAADMVAQGYFSHASPSGMNFDGRISGAGYVWSTVAENIAAGQATPEDVVRDWLSSPGHCRNVMNAALKEIGVGYAQGGAYRHYWVQDFGTAR